MKKGIHRATADSKRGRQMISPGMEHNPWDIPADIRAWNAKVEQRKLEKQARKAIVKRGHV